MFGTNLGVDVGLNTDSFLDLDMNESILLGLDQKEPEDGTASTDTISDALMKCLRDIGKVDIRRIAESSGSDTDQVIANLKGSIFRNPDIWDHKTENGWETAEEYLSGNIIVKLGKAKEANRIYRGKFDDNIRALEQILPNGTDEGDIYLTLGSPWLPTDIICDFVNYIVQPYDFHRCDDVEHDENTGLWKIPKKDRYKQYHRNTEKYGTSRIDAVTIIERTLNMRNISITDGDDSEDDGEKKRIENPEETLAATEKQKLIQSEFGKWIWADENRRKRVKRIYDSKYGYRVARKFDGSFLEFPGMSDKYTLFTYQKNAVARILFSPNTLLAHDVGAGKTYIMIAAAMELKRLGMTNKTMFVVPNNLLRQWGDTFIKLYPGADILCVGPTMFDPENREKTFEKLRNTNNDGIIIAASCFDRIPLSKEKYIVELEEEKERLSNEQNRLLKEKASDETELRKSVLDEKLKNTARLLRKLREDEEHGGILYFEELGVDRLFVDEAHNYKNMSFKTSMSGVLGLSSQDSRKCNRMMDKIMHVQNTHNGNGVVMATGTPITNSVSDIYVFQKYLQSGALKLMSIPTFNSWAQMFAERTKEIEIAVDTSKCRTVERFTRFHNLGGLTNMLAMIADFHSIDSGEGIPEFNGYTDVVIPKSKMLEAYLKDISMRADRVYRREVDPQTDNMLKITNDGRRAALDIRLVDLSRDETELTGNEPCKVSECASNAAKIYHNTEKNRLTQLIFCDMSTPRDGFNLYDDMKSLLISHGVNKEEIAYVHDASTEEEKEKLFEKVRTGKIRILMGSTMKLGLGVNVQDRLIAVHHLDVPWRPADMVQREGRILRSGNQNKSVEIFRYITEGSFDAYSWQLLETKQRFIAEILSGTLTGRSGDDVDTTALNYAEVKALALGNPLLKNWVEVKNEITKLSIMRKRNVEKKMQLGKRYVNLSEQKSLHEEELRSCCNDYAFAAETRNSDDEAFLSWRSFIGKNIDGLIRDNIDKAEERRPYEYRGFVIVLPAGMRSDQPYLYLSRESRYKVDIKDLGADIMRCLDSKLDSLEECKDEIRSRISTLEKEISSIEADLSVDECYSDEIEENMKKLTIIDKELKEDITANRRR